VQGLVTVDKRFTFRNVPEELRISCGSYYAISTKDFGIRHVTEVCPTAAEQKKCLSVASDLLKHIEKVNFLKSRSYWAS
jgi:hypothetical protein